MAPISPQGPGQFGGFDDGPSNNTWSGNEIAAFNLVGGDETDTNALGIFFFEGWRLTPFERFPSTDDKFQSILPGQDHLAMGEFAPPATRAYLAGNTRLFFDVYLREDPSGVCGIGTSPSFDGQILAAKTEPATGRAAACPPPIGLPEPALMMVLTPCVALLIGMGRRPRRRPSEPVPGTQARSRDSVRFGPANHASR